MTINKVISRNRNGKAPEMDGINMEMLKNKWKKVTNNK